MNRYAAFNTRYHLVLDPDIGKSAAHHDFVVAASRAVGIKIGLFDFAGR